MSACWLRCHTKHTWWLPLILTRGPSSIFARNISWELSPSGVVAAQKMAALASMLLQGQATNLQTLFSHKMFLLQKGCLATKLLHLSLTSTAPPQFFPTVCVISFPTCCSHLGLKSPYWAFFIQLHVQNLSSFILKMCLPSVSLTHTESS